jgi:pyruvate kinase
LASFLGLTQKAQLNPRSARHIILYRAGEDGEGGTDDDVKIESLEELDSIYYKEHTPQVKTITYITDSICYNACSLAHNAGAQAIISMTNSGYTAFKLSSHRPKAPVFIFTDNPSLLTMLSLVWGVRGFYYDKYESTDQTIDDLKDIIKNKGLLKNDDLVINIASMPMKEKGRTNMMKLSYIS